jgi:hypothetical protein
MVVVVGVELRLGVEDASLVDVRVGVSLEAVVDVGLALLAE